MEYKEKLLAEALRYLGVRGQPPADVAQQVRQALDRLLPLCAPVTCGGCWTKAPFRMWDWIFPDRTSTSY